MATLVKGVPPDITITTFLDYLRERRSPVSDVEGAAVYAYCVQRRLSPAYLLGVFTHESQCGTEGIAAITHSWGNTRSPSFGGVVELGQVRGHSGSFPIFRNWIDGGISTVARLFDYAPYQGKDTVEAIIPTWAPATDQNDPDAYIQAVLITMRALVAQEGTRMVPKPPMTSLPSPNRDGYHGTRHAEALVLHITDGTDSRGWLTNPASSASANYLIERDGVIYELVPPDHDAWANGRVQRPDTSNPLIARWLTERDANGNPINFNQRTISIEHEGKSSHNIGGSLTPAQVSASVALQAWLCATWGITPDQDHILGHYQIDSVDRGFCPGFSGQEWHDWVIRVADLVHPPAVDKSIPLHNAYSQLPFYIVGLKLFEATADLSQYGLDPRAQCLVCEKAVLWSDGTHVDAMHRGQYESLVAEGKVQEWK